MNGELPALTESGKSEVLRISLECIIPPTRAPKGITTPAHRHLEHLAGPESMVIGTK